MNRYFKPFLIIFLVLLFDQIFKIWVKTNMLLFDRFSVFGNWFYIYFIENDGAAFGLKAPGAYGKIALTTFRIIAASVIMWYMLRLIKKGFKNGFIACIALIFSGAVGNIIDSVFYGKIFGYDKLFFGHVVDMLYFPIIHTRFPSWFPLIGGNDFLFFSPIFNISDASITIGVLSLLIFYRKTLKTI